MRRTLKTASLIVNGASNVCHGTEPFEQSRIVVPRLNYPGVIKPQYQFILTSVLVLFETLIDSPDR